MAHQKRWEVSPQVHAAMVRRAKEARKNPTPSQNLLWQAVRRKALGVRFRREQPIGPYRVDFFIASRKIIVEVDGSIHQYQIAEDLERQRNLETLGFRFVRIPASDVMKDLAGVLERLRKEIG